MKRIIYTIVAIGSISIVSCSSNKKETEKKETPILVTIGNSGGSSDMHNTSASGKLVAKNTVNISTRMMGYITGIKVEVGQRVSAGQLLVTINNTDIQAKGGQASAQIMQAQASYNIAKKDFERFTKLFEAQSASQKELDDMRTRYEMAKAGLDAAQMMKNEVNAQNRYASLTAPISGVVTAAYAKQGDMANPGMPILTIEAPSNLQAQVLASESQIQQIKSGQSVNVYLKSTNLQTKGTISEISYSSTNTGGQYLVKIDIAKEPSMLPGMFVNVEFPNSNINTTSAAASASVTIPVSALVEQGQLKGIYTISENNTAILRWVKTGKTMGEQIEILSGLHANESYIVSAQGKLYNGAAVKVK